MYIQIQIMILIERIRLYDRHHAKVNMLSARTPLAQQEYFRMLSWEEYRVLDTCDMCHIFCTHRSA